MKGIRIRDVLIALAACCISTAAIAGPWRAGVAERNGLLSLSKGGVEALSSDFKFWGKNWAFADQEIDFRIRAPFDYSIAGKNQALNFNLLGRITRASERQLVWEFDLDALTRSSGVIGGGISFTFDLANFGSELGEPELLPGNLGWVWGRAGGNRIELRFDHPMATIYFEHGQKSEVRAFFYKDDIPQGHRHYLATLNISGDISLSPTAQEKFGVDDYVAWPTGILGSDKAPVDLSFLNAGESPAGKRGLLQARGDRLVFEDGTVARFWGTNLTAYTLFATSKDDVKRQAHRLSQLGFNLVRLHHHDSEWVDPNIFGDRNTPSTLNLSAAMLEKLDWWMKCLKDEGIYVWLDLHVGRRLKPADGIDGFTEISQGHPTAGLFGYNYVNQSIREAMKRFNELYLGHQNRFTGLRYKDDPADRWRSDHQRERPHEPLWQCVAGGQGSTQTHGNLHARGGEFRGQVRASKRKGLACVGGWTIQTISQRSRTALRRRNDCQFARPGCESAHRHDQHLGIQSAQFAAGSDHRQHY